jgi:hypothetical protein
MFSVVQTLSRKEEEEEEKKIETNNRVILHEVNALILHMPRATFGPTFPMI